MAMNYSTGLYDERLTAAFRDFMFENSPIAALIHQEMKRGKSAAKAMDFIVGDGCFAKFAEEIYNSIRGGVS